MGEEKTVQEVRLAGTECVRPSLLALPNCNTSVSTIKQPNKEGSGTYMAEIVAPLKWWGRLEWECCAASRPSACCRGCTHPPRTQRRWSRSIWLEDTPAGRSMGPWRHAELDYKTCASLSRRRRRRRRGGSGRGGETGPAAPRGGATAASPAARRGGQAYREGAGEGPSSEVPAACVIITSHHIFASHHIITSHRIQRPLVIIQENNHA